MRVLALFLVVPFMGAIIFAVADRRAATEEQPASVTAEQGERRPVVVELFTSEGCSSCPPADALLEKLDQAQLVSGAQVIPMSEHVDYWNYIGWTDPYSSSTFSRRQDGYARRFGLQSIYTPQVVIDGSAELVGNDDRRIKEAIKKSSQAAKVEIRISPVTDTSGVPTVNVDVAPVSQPTGLKDAHLILALANNSAVSHVLRGENRGRELRHVAVVRSLTDLGRFNPIKGFSQSVPLTGELKQWDGMRLIAFVQEREYGRIQGAAVRVLTVQERPKPE